MQSALEESLHKLSVNMCVSVFVLALQTCTLANNGNFVCTLACVWSFHLKCERLRVHACVSERVCEGIGIPSPWAIRGQTDPIMFVLGDQAAFPPGSLHADAPFSQLGWITASTSCFGPAFAARSVFGGLFGCGPPELLQWPPCACLSGFRGNWLHWPGSRMWCSLSARTETVCLFRKDTAVITFWC